MAELVLDTSAGLCVEAVSVNGARVEHTMKQKHEVFGTPCAVPLSSDLRHAGTELKVLMAYSTSTECSALQWLPPEQTAGKVYPYMFSQCQAIHARPPVSRRSHRQVHLRRGGDGARLGDRPDERGLARRPHRQGGATREFAFEQTVPVPSYLVAIAVGELRGIEVGPRSTVWAEPSVVDAAAWEFAECEDFLQAGEAITGCAYIWGKYDVLCMPPSFPYGGMENPCLTFATPTLLAGDRSLANVIAHEIAHSWTGNNVTNHTWEHFWLNEGWTRWLENRILAKREGAGGEALYDFSMQESKTHLEDAVQTFGATSPLTALVPQLDGVDPDDAFSAVPYEKGLALLNHLTETVGGRAAFEAFAKAYIGAFQRKTLTSADFRDFFLRYCEEREIDASGVDWDAWFYNPGMPPVDATYADELGGACTKVAERWLAEHSASDASFDAATYQAWPSKLKIHFHETLLARSLAAAAPPMSLAALKRMDELYSLSASRNSEVRFRWQRLCIVHRADFIVPQALAFLKEVGRMKFVRRLFRDLYAWEAHREAAVEQFKGWRENYHPIAAKMLAQDLKVA